MIHRLPAPTWAQSENNLLPKWLRFLKEHKLRYGNGAIERAESQIRSAETDIKYYKGYVGDYSQQIKEYKQRIAELAKLKPVTDEELRAYFEQLIKLPELLGVRLDRYGRMVLLVDPVLPEHEDRDLGIYEISYETLSGTIWLLNCSEELRYSRLVDYNTMEIDGKHRKLRFYGLSEETARKFGTTGDVVSYVKALPAALGRGVDARRLAQRKAERETPWSGIQIADPVVALRKLMESSGAAPAQRIEELERGLKIAEQEKKNYLAYLRERQTELRSYQQELVELKKLAEQADNGVDVEAAKKMLRYISTLRGVVAIKFVGNTPVLHVRCSFPYKGKRYDMGDFELHLELEHKLFGTVLKVRRTRTPLGGTYEAGWHTSQNGFCFGSRDVDIINAWNNGDIGDAVSVAIATMSTIEKPEWELHRARPNFAEIAYDDVPQRKLRTRTRRKLGRAGLTGATFS